MISLPDVHAARQRLQAVIYCSPCSFKERGAANTLLTLSGSERSRGVITASAGNHGLAVAFHAQRLGIQAVIVMPE